MNDFFRKLFNIYPGEEKNAILFGLLGFFWALAVTSGLKYADALFLLHVGAESLPIAYIFTAIGLFCIAAILIKTFDNIPIHYIYITTLSIGVCFYTFASFAYYFEMGVETNLLWFALRIFGTTFFAVAVTCYWTFIDQYHHLQDAKRLYSLFTSMIFLGIATTGSIMRMGIFDFQYIMIGIMGVLLFCIYWILKITRTITPVSEWEDWEGSGLQTNPSLKSLIQAIVQSRFTLLLMSANFITYLLLVLTEYNYLLSFDQHFAHTTAYGEEEDATLTLFLGQCIAFVSIANLLFGLFIYSRLVKRFGSSSLLIVTPSILLFTFLGWPLSDSLFFPILGFLVVEGTLYVIDDSNFNLLLNAVPNKVKYKIRIIIESFFEPIGMLISAILLSIPGLNSKFLGLILSGVLLFVALVLRKKYFKSIYQNLTENAIHFDRAVPSWFNRMNAKDYRSNEYRLVGILKHGDLEAQLFATEALVDMEDASILKKVLHEVDKFNPSAKIRFLDLIFLSPFAEDSQVLDHIYKWFQTTPEETLRNEIKFYLARKGLLHPEKAFDDLDNPMVLAQGAAIVALETAWPHLSPHQVNLNRMIASQQLQKLLESKLEEDISVALRILSSKEHNDFDLIIPFLKSEDTLVVRNAAKALAQIADKGMARYIPLLITQLKLSSDNETKLYLLQALGKTKNIAIIKDIIQASSHFRPNERRMAEKITQRLGLRTVPLLLASVKDTHLQDRSRLLAGKILGKLSVAQLRANLEEIIKVEIERAYFYFYYSKTLCKDNPDKDLALLEMTLHSSFQSVQDFIIQLLGVAGEIEDVELLSRSIKSPNPKIRSQVIETLERTCEPNIYRHIQPLISDIPDSEKIHYYGLPYNEKSDLIELLDILEQSSSTLDKMIAASFKHRFNIGDWRLKLLKQMTTNEENFQRFAYELLET
ncbi:MAG: hypothetical protein BGO10_09015 [Chlamydia sp. 32-24]|nr:MAG: hypothetical protein BGO10_09015 [Chlamydia sp. 32-24]